MESKVENSIKVTLVLDAKEAYWLKSLLQNYMGDGEEGEQEANMRVTLFNALPWPHEITGT